jgi:hypothetical protein
MNGAHKPEAGGYEVSILFERIVERVAEESSVAEVQANYKRIAAQRHERRELKHLLSNE